MWPFCHYCAITNNGVTIKPAKRIKPLNLFIVALAWLSSNFWEDVEKLIKLHIKLYPHSPCID